MTTLEVKLKLSDSLASQAQAAGLLNSEAIGKLKCVPSANASTRLANIMFRRWRMKPGLSMISFSSVIGNAMFRWDPRAFAYTPLLAISILRKLPMMRLKTGLYLLNVPALHE